MESANLTKISQPPPLGEIGELVLQNGRQAGTRRPLGVPTTFIGRSQGCDIRLNIEGIDPMHCALVFGPDGLMVRDLNSTQGTFVNGERVVSLAIRHGDLLKIGPFQFRVEISTAAIVDNREQMKRPAGDMRDGMHIQVAAVAAQQIALEEDEMRMNQRQSDLRQQEEQLAAHLEEKQRQVQMWSDHTKAEREELRKQKAEQHKLLTQWEQELNEAKEHLGQEQQQLFQERQRINKVYQRLRHRWQRQWSAVKEKYQEQYTRLEAESHSLEQRQAAFREQENALAQELQRFKTERELNARQLQESWDELNKSQQAWRRRQAQERTLVKERQQELEDTLVKMTGARQLLQQEKQSWEKRHEAMQQELHGLNNRVIHQREKLKEQEDRMFLLDQELRTRLLNLKRVAEIETAGKKGTDANHPQIVETSYHLDTEPGTALVPIGPAANGPQDHGRREILDRLAGELADQRLHLLEQFKRLAEIQESWSLQRDSAAQELEATAQNLYAHDLTLTRREEKALEVEDQLQKEREELQSVRQEIESWHARLKEQEQGMDQEFQQRQQAIRQQEMLLQEQLSGLTYLRQRWNRRRQEEVETMRADQTQLKQHREELLRQRQDLFARDQQLAEEKRILAEKSLVVELYRQEVSNRANDPAAQRRMERLRRRWVLQNAILIRNAKRESEAVKKEMSALDMRYAEWLKQVEQISKADVILGEKLALLDEKEAKLKTREQRLAKVAKQSEPLLLEGKEKHLNPKDEAERMTKLVYEEPDPPRWSNDKAA